MGPLSPRGTMQALCVLAMLAMASGASGKEPPPPAPRRVFGFGLGLGGGYEWAGGPQLSAGALTLEVIDVGVVIPVRRTLELQVWIPVIGIASMNFLYGPSFSADVALKIRWRDDERGFFVAPGLGLTWLELRNSSATGVTVKAAVRIGHEWALRRRRCSVSLAGRPELGFLVASSAGTRAAAAFLGIVAEASFTFYLFGR